MSASELIDYLTKLPPDTPVVVWDGIAGVLVQANAELQQVKRTMLSNVFAQFKRLTHKNNVTVVVLR